MTRQTTPLRIGTRGSPLALAQAYETRDRLMAAHGMAESDFDIQVIKTSGDRIQDRPLSEVGGKGLFTKEIQEALLAGEIDLAVHSMKDVATVLPEPLEIRCFLPRAPVCDALIGEGITGLEDLAEGAVVGTSSLRRRAQLKAMRPDLQVVEFRGNVQTRLQKLKDGVARATFLARAGLVRLGHDTLGTDVPVDQMLPAVAQGAIGIETRVEDGATAALLAPINTPHTQVEVTAERAFLRVLDGSCRTPIAGLARLEGDVLQFEGEVLSHDGSRCMTVSRTGSASEADALGAAAGEWLLEQGAAEVLAPTGA